MTACIINNKIQHLSRLLKQHKTAFIVLLYVCKQHREHVEFNFILLWLFHSNCHSSRPPVST